MKKVLHLITGVKKGGGAEKMLLLTLPYLKSAEHAVCVLKGRGEIGEQLETAGIKVFYLEASGWLDFNLIARYKNVVRAFAPDIQINYLIHADFFGRLFARRAGVKKVFSYIRNRHTKLLFQVLDFLTLTAVDYLLTNSSSVLDFYRHRYRFPAQRSAAISNGIDLSPSPLLFEPEKLRLELGLDGEDEIFLSVARLHPQKDLPTLFRALLNVKETSHFKFKLLVAGDGAERANLERLAYDLGLSEQIKFLGVRNDIPNLLKLADVFILPSLHEGMSNALLEAMKEGRPCVVSDIPENVELIKDGENGLSFKAGKALALAEKIKQLVANPKEAALFGEAAKKTIADYDINKIIVQLDDFFTERLNDKKKIVWVANDRNDIYVNFYNALGELHPDLNLVMVAGETVASESNEKHFYLKTFKFSLRWVFKLLCLPISVIAKLKGKKTDFWNFDFYFGLFGFLVKENPDLVMVNLYLQPTSWQTLIYCLIYRKPFFLLEEKKNYGRGRLRSLLSIFLLRASFPIFALSKKVLCYTSDCFNFGRSHFPIFNKKKISLFPGSVDTRLFYNQNLPKNDDIFKILTIARMVPFKRYEDLFRAAKSLQDRNLFDFVLNIRGDGMLEADLNRLIDELGIRSKVNFIPQTPYSEQVNVFNQNDIFVLPSVNEPIGIVVPEAMACGLPVVVSDTCGAKTYVKDGVNGFIFKTYDYFDLADKIIQLYDLEKRKAMGPAAEETIKKEFDSQVVAENFYQEAKDWL